MKEIKDGYKETEIGVLSVDWEAKSLASLSIRIGDGLHGTPKYSDNSEYYFVNGNNLKDGKINFNDGNKMVDKTEFEKHKVDLRKSSILISLNGTIGSLAFYENEKIILSKSAGYITLKDSVSREYIYYSLQTKIVKDYILKEITGTTIRNLSLKTLRNILIPLPPLPEQKRIAEILSAIDAHIEKLNATITDTQFLKNGMMRSLLTQGIGHTEFKDTEIGQIPKAWEVATIKNCTKKIIGGGTPSRGNSEFYNGNIPWITVKDLDCKFYKDDATEHITEDAIAKCSTNLIVENTVIIATRMGLGRGFINTKPVAINQDMKALILNEFIDQRYFLFWYLSNATIIEKLGTGTTVKGIRLETLKDLVLPLPPIPEQHRIVEILSAIDDRIRLYEKEKEDFIKLKKGLMEQLLTGKIRLE